MASKITCLVTLHGIGFEQPPQDGVDNSGYADSFHHHLHSTTSLEEILSDDPKRQRQYPGDNGAIYVQSRWLNAQGNPSSNEGLKRLGTWSQDKKSISTDDAPLVADGKSVAHVALVYSNLESVGNETGAALISFIMSLFSVAHYTSAHGLAHFAADIAALARKQQTPSPQLPSSSHPRTDLSPSHQRQAPPSTASGTMGALKYLANDVACYVCQNEERERVRSFVREALTRLATRDDVEAIIFNTHSNGTVVGFDVLRHLPEIAAGKIKAFVTAGSPLRKYVDLFHWGNQIQCLNPIKPWYNFWDPYDPVADPLAPPPGWRAGDPIHPTDEKLFSSIDLDSGIPSCIPVDDCTVNNIEHSYGGSLQAHNYWDNEIDFIPQLAEIIHTIATA
jgi:hypothetical protein